MLHQSHNISEISNKTGHIDFSITISCSPSWKEIKRALLLERFPYNRSDLAFEEFTVMVSAIVTYIIDEKVSRWCRNVRTRNSVQRGGSFHNYCIQFPRGTSTHWVEHPGKVHELWLAEFLPFETKGFKILSWIGIHFIHHAARYKFLCNLYEKWIMLEFLLASAAKWRYIVKGDY